MATSPDYPFTRGDAMRRALFNAKITPKQAAIRMGIGYRTILKWFNDETTPESENLVAFVELTGEERLYDWFKGSALDSRCYPNIAGQLTEGVAA